MKENHNIRFKMSGMTWQSVILDGEKQIPWIENVKNDIT